MSFSLTVGFLVSSRKKHPSVPEVVSDPASRISDIWSMISRVFIRVPVSGRTPSLMTCCSKSEGQRSGLLLRLWMIRSIAFITVS